MTADGQLKNKIMSAVNSTKSDVKDEILNKILSVMDEKQKTHDDILFGT